jgi:hypothetical protein
MRAELARSALLGPVCHEPQTRGPGIWGTCATGLILRGPCTTGPKRRSRYPGCVQHGIAERFRVNANK